MKKYQQGFTLIELMIVVAIIGILAAIAVPAYQDFMVRGKISEALIAASVPKAAVSEGFSSDGLAGVTAAADAFNAKPIAERSSKFVSDVAIDTGTGVITVTLATAAGSGLPTDALGATIVFSPNVQNAALATGVSGAVDWACGTTTTATAGARGLGSVNAGTLPSKYAPAECK